MNSLVKNPARALLATLALSSLGGCGGAVQTRNETTIARRPAVDPALAEARARARAMPNDAAAQTTWADLEAFGEGGDPAAVDASMARAVALAPEDVGLAYAQGVIAAHRGRPGEAVDALLRVLQHGPSSTDPLATDYVGESVLMLRGLSTDAPDVYTRVIPTVEALYRAPGNLGFTARRIAFFWLLDRARVTGDVARVTALEQEMSCPTTARVAGPFGIYPMRAFDTALAAEGSGPMAARYDLGPGRGMAATRTVEGEQCGLELRSTERATSGAGTRVVEATLHANATGHYTLALDTEASVRVSIDGHSVGVIDRRREEHPVVVMLPLELTAGDHELEIKVTSREAVSWLAWTLDAQSGNYDPAVHSRPPETSERAVGRYVIVRSLRSGGLRIAAREAMIRFSGGEELVTEGTTSPWLQLAADIVSSDTFAPESRRTDDERALVARSLERDPNSYRPIFDNAAMEPEQDRRLAALRAVAERFPQLPSAWLYLRDQLINAEFFAEARTALAHAAEASPESCTVRGAQFDDLIDRGRYPAAEAFIPSLMVCNARDRSALSLAMARRDWPAADAEMARLSPMLTDDERREIGLAMASARGDTAAETRLRAEVEREAEEGALVVLQADRRYAAGDRAGARQILETEAARAPDETQNLRRLLFALSSRDIMEPYRVDGLAAVRRFEASGRNYTGFPSVLVFDYMVTRIQENGSAIDLVHQIFRIQTQQGIEHFAAIPLPGRVLTVRVVRPDGTILEPNEVAAQTDLPPLSIGDYVEYELVREHAPRWGDGYQSDGWTFQNYAEPFDHSEMVFVAPEAMPLTFDVRGPVPPAVVTTEGGLRTHRFLMTEQRPLVAEPNAFPEPAVQPSLRAGVRVSWERMLGSVDDLLADRDPVDPSAARLLAREIHAGPEVPAALRVQRIHRWVVENIEASDGFFEFAPSMISVRSGSPVRVLRYLLAAAGIDATIGVARRADGDRPHDLPSSAVYSEAVVRVSIEGRDLWLSTLGRGTAHNLLPPTLAGQEVVMLDGQLTHARLPLTQGQPTQQQTQLTVDVQPNGAALIEGQIVWSGVEAAQLREALRDVPPAERNRVIAERFVPSIIPGGEGDPARVAILGLDDWEEPVTIRFAAASNALFSRDEQAIRMAPLFQTGIEREFAQLSVRTTSELLSHVRQELELTVRGPFNFVPPPSRRAEGPGGAMAEVISETNADGSAHTIRRIAVPTSVVPVADYAALTRFCEQVAAMESQSVAIRR